MKAREVLGARRDDTCDHSLSRVPPRLQVLVVASAASCRYFSSMLSLSCCVGEAEEGHRMG